MKYTLITGASSGIGKALSYQFASRGYNLIITARREDELQKLKQDIESQYAVQVIAKPCDLAQEGQAEDLYHQLADFELVMIINNAGFGDFSMPWDIDLAKANRMLDLNVKALTTLSLLYTRDYADREATLINVSSVGGYSLFDIAVTYCATKFFVAAFTEGLAQNLRDQGKKMRAKVIAPGPTQSEFVAHSSDNGGISGDGLFADDSFITAEKLADYTWKLFESDSTVGIVNADRQLTLKPPVYPYITVPH
ncbi:MULTISPECIES: SDR family NAD(P)-dependent oxidoreductase [Citrobacter]|uniref:SDR family NAD(P)-dependent oxidoreductase n=1 Tax=Citrobacter TaxID=544 RepID=UPI002578E1E5|nr:MULTISPECIES: SDR family NAD(P)-dependent oxidoreductase [Citrobacter]MDM2999300.1 SDR family NAD(P)-dependent oxidoreductase [Citrobacter sp. CK192]MDM3021913.1 SDR family NAD(P)-dependent oxidoreductase [Citrobacter sp. CK193]MEB2704604.1 SDR family NAD(P)-dependent oxidoreductase [Citrobacter koseri]MEB2709366.1 SDR family NAD(P)-dependent oxidoreductase [Citrobacter koseri]